MDPNPNNFPILSYVMSKLPSMTPRRAAAAAEFDVEQPPPASPSSEPHFELTERMPHLTDPKIIASMRSAVEEVAKTRSVLRALGERPDHESVDNAKAKLVEIEDGLSKQMEEISLSSGSSSDVERGGQGDSSLRKSAEDDIQMYKAVITLDEMHEAYEKMLQEAETKLEMIYEMAVAGADGGPAAVAVEEVPVEEVNEEVVAILQEASGKEIDRIDLSGKKLRLLPEAFGQIRGLLKLDLSHNHLVVIPDSIAGLEKLEELNLSANLLESLPDTIGLLTNLKILNVSGNKLKALPDSICHCRSLVELDVSFNKLTYLPTNIGYELVNLKKLSIFLNKIRSLPTSIGEMKSLGILDVHFNELHGLPITIGKLENLESLNLSGNFSDLTELPETFGDLVNLKELDLSNNQIHALPNTFGRLDNLTKLNVDQNPLAIPPKEVVDKGVEAVKHFMAMRWLDILMEEERKSTIDAQDQSPTSLFTRSTSWLSNAVSNFSRSASGYLRSAGRSNADPDLDQQL